MRCLVEDPATFAVTAGAWLRREPVLHNVLLTLVAERLSGDVPLSGDERFVRVVDGDATVLIKRFASETESGLTQTS
ncbi:hypothetical protein ACFYPX_25720 [Micromonospora zamorensis]|uniref:hypothetical protein n=1 Tax=Micromonospora zamorensis TaxID=709883 RepID=UPI003687990C